MDPSRYGRQQEWDNNSAPEGYGTQHDPNHRFGVSYDDGYPDERLMRDDVYNYPPGHNTLGDLPQSRKRNYEENYPSELRRQEKPYIDSNYAADYYHDSEAGSRNGHYRDHEHERSSRYDGCDDYSCNDNNYRSKNYHHSRDDGREKDYDYTRRSYDSEYERASVSAAGLVVILSMCLTIYGISSFKEGEPSIAPSLTLTGRKKQPDQLQTADGWAKFTGGFFFGGISGVTWAYFLLYVLDLPYFVK